MNNRKTPEYYYFKAMEIMDMKGNLKKIKFLVKVNLNGMKKKNILENGIIMKYVDMVFY